MEPSEFDAGNDQSIVVYVSPDTGTEVDPASLFETIAADAKARAGRGQRIVTMTSPPLRHAAVAFGREGSGFETKLAIVVVYARA
jgi:hypothetical protein